MSFKRGIYDFEPHYALKECLGELNSSFSNGNWQVTMCLSKQLSHVCYVGPLCNSQYIIPLSFFFPFSGSGS